VVGISVGGNALGGEFEDDWRLPGVDSQQAYDLLAERFPSASGSSAMVVYHAPDAALQAPARADAIEASLAEIATLPHVVAVSDPFGQDGGVSPDGTTAFSQVTFDTDVGGVGIDGFHELENTAQGAAVDGLQVEIGGELASASSEAETGSSEMMGLLAAVIILLLAFGSVVAMGLPIGTAIVGLGTGFGIITIVSAFLKVPEVSTVLSSMIGLGVGIDYALFVVTRYRQNLRNGMEPLDAVGRATATAGQAVVFAGATVVISILGLWISGIAFVGMMGVAAAIMVAVAVVAAITLLPAFMGFAGRAIDSLSLPWAKRGREKAEDQGMWARWGREVERRPWRYLLGALALLIALALPLFSIELGMPDDGSAPQAETRRRAYDLLAEGFGPGFNGPFLLAVEIDDPAALDGLGQLQQAIENTDGVATVTPVTPNETGNAAIISVIPTTAPQDPATPRLVHHLRDEVIPAATPDGAKVWVGGLTATFIDMSDKIATATPWFIAAVVGLSFLLLMMVFRSVLVPLKAAILNLLSIGAAYGVVVAIFQWGWGRGLIGVQEAIPIVSFVPMFMFAILFGLSMDYEVFLLSRVREEYLHGKGNAESVVSGISTTARVITSAALIMIVVFLSFVTQADPIVKMFGIGLATAVFIDATVVRVVLVPSTMMLLGNANWWLPNWLDRILPTMDLEGVERSGEAAAPEPQESPELA
jgi:RND superfamily putative drug exporter